MTTNRRVIALAAVVMQVCLGVGTIIGGLWQCVASVAAIAGSLLTRIGWIAAGCASARQKV
jgi:hypothetical protein